MRTIFKFPRSSPFAGENLTRSVILSIRLAWGCGHQDGLNNFEMVPKFVYNTSLLPSLRSTFLSDRGTLIISGIFSSSRPRVGLSPSVGSISIIFSVVCYRHHTRHIDILPVWRALSNLLPEPGCDAHRDPRRISCWRNSVFHQAFRGFLETALSHPPWRSQYSGTHSGWRWRLSFPSSYFLSLSGGTSGRWRQTLLTRSISRSRWHLSSSLDLIPSYLEQCVAPTFGTGANPYRPVWVCQRL